MKAAQSCAVFVMEDEMCLPNITKNIAKTIVDICHKPGIIIIIGDICHKLK